jgi:phosphatidate cytidylyltransferase
VLKQRVVTAVVLLGALLAAAAAGRLALDVILALFVGAATFEWLRLAQHSPALCIIAAAVFAAVLIAARAASAVPPPELVGAVSAAATLAWLSIAVLVLRGAHRGARLVHGISTFLAVLLLAAAWIAMMHLLDHGATYLLSVLAIVWLADIAAYFAGRRWGRRKLAPAISPGKTWAGVAGAVVAVLAAAMLLAVVAPGLPALSTLLERRLALPAALALLALLVALSIVGDLFESLLKRQVNVKDSSGLLPGHGGVLDRIDALVAVLPAAALLDLWLRQ